MIFSHVDLNPTIRALEIGSIISLRARDPNSSSTCVLLLVYFILRRLLEYKGFGASLFSTSSQSELTGAKVQSGTGTIFPMTLKHSSNFFRVAIGSWSLEILLTAVVNYQRSTRFIMITQQSCCMEDLNN